MITITFTANLGADPELRTVKTSNGETSVVNLRLATNRVYRKGDENVTETTWVDVAVWGAQAESCNTYLQKGSKVLVKASRMPVADAYMKDGDARASLKLTADQIEFLDSRNSNGNSNNEAPAQSSTNTDDIPF